ncbi:c-type cytochrome [Mangrovibrevibacter kandeliae]|uniref:c-type cytochrome n=1 Tax=Mangrovibrevibacter kandeliae TaxID=2968473 RepID=UPI0021194145|nr:MULTISPECIES: c-type cytochrome [unclassified Aurantimonas]MCQ8783494.1 c-type cytochrome [Aurantimonas sp. CSK15Z-1]MCW4115990.1 c-type cytochrome [Aurantimonas sp. MSK8Z-1]
MDSFEVNKILGAVLGTVFLVFGGSLLAEGIFHSEVPEKPGFVVAAAEEAAPAAGGAEETKEEPIEALLQSADASAGEAQFKKCQACHDGSKGGANKVGPHLWDVVGRPIASISDFSYSAAMKDFSKGGEEHWDYDHLYYFLANPKQRIPGTAMGFAGLKKPEDRANLIAYLRTLSDNPQPLPPPPAEGADTAAPAGDQPAATDPSTTTDSNAAVQGAATTDTTTTGNKMGTASEPAPATAPATGDTTPNAPQPEGQPAGAPTAGDTSAPAGEGAAPAQPAPAQGQPAPAQ